jgi:hypothetical protein
MSVGTPGSSGKSDPSFSDGSGALRVAGSGLDGGVNLRKEEK